MLQSTLIKAKNDKITDFNHIAIDKTIIKANNFNYNIIKLEKIKVLLKLLNQSKSKIREYLENKNNPKLRRPTYKLLKNKNKSTNDKIGLLKNLKNILLETRQSNIGLSDSNAR